MKMEVDSCMTACSICGCDGVAQVYTGEDCEALQMPRAVPIVTAVELVASKPCWHLAEVMMHQCQRC